MRALRGPAGSLLASVLVAALFGGAAMALPGHPFASPQQQAIERQASPEGRTHEAPPTAHIERPGRGNGAPTDPGALGHTRADQRGAGASGRTNAKNPDTHANSGRTSGVPGQPAPASDGHASSYAPNA